MESNAILHEVQQLYNASDRLASLAELHPSGFRRSDHHLRKHSQHGHIIGSAGGDEDNSAFRTRSSKGLALRIAGPEKPSSEETSREGRHLGVNYELAAPSQHHSR